MDRVSKSRPCPICGKPDWCLRAEDGSAAICQRVAEGSVKQCGEAGYLHVLRDDPNWRERPQRRTVRLDRDGGNRPDLGVLAAEYAAAVDLAELQDFAKELGLSVESLIRLRIGWAEQHRAWAFPMHGPDLDVRGIRLRSWSGRKWSVRGGREGLFLPVGLDFSGPLLTCEGPTDTAALLDLGFEAVGRPSCTGGTKLLIELVRRRQPPGVVIFADGDGPGQRGAESLASALIAYCPAVWVIRPPDGIKDARAWNQADAAREDVQAAIDAAPIRRLRTKRRPKS